MEILNTFINVNGQANYDASTGNLLTGTKQTLDNNGQIGFLNKGGNDTSDHRIYANGKYYGTKLDSNSVTFKATSINNKPNTEFSLSIDANGQIAIKSYTPIDITASWTTPDPAVTGDMLTKRIGTENYVTLYSYITGVSFTPSVNTSDAVYYAIGTTSGGVDVKAKTACNVAQGTTSSTISISGFSSSITDSSYNGTRDDDGYSTGTGTKSATTYKLYLTVWDSRGNTSYAYMSTSARFSHWYPWHIGSVAGITTSGQILTSDQVYNVLNAKTSTSGITSKPSSGTLSSGTTADYLILPAQYLDTETISFTPKGFPASTSGVKQQYDITLGSAKVKYNVWSLGKWEGQTVTF